MQSSTSINNDGPSSTRMVDGWLGRPIKIKDRYDIGYQDLQPVVLYLSKKHPHTTFVAENKLTPGANTEN